MFELGALIAFFMALANLIWSTRLELRLTALEESRQRPRQPVAVAVPVAEMPAVAVPLPVPVPVPVPVAVERPRVAARPDLELRFGQQWLVRIGVLLLLVAGGLFARHAVSQGWISPALRLVIGAALGCGLWGAGFAARRRSYDALAQGLFGGGTALLYLVSFAAFHLYGLVPRGVSFAAMLLTTGVTAAVALPWGALALALLAQIGGLATPALIGGEANLHGLCGYLLALQVGLAWVATRLGFGLVLPVGVAGTWGYLLAIATASTAEGAWGLGFALLFLLAGSRGGLQRLAGVVISAGAWLVHGWHTLGAEHPQVLGLLAAGFGVAHGLLSVRRMDVAGRETLRVLGLALVFAAAPIAFGGNALTLAWLGMAIAFLQLGMRYAVPIARYAGFGCLMLTVARVLTVHASLELAPWFVMPEAGYVLVQPFWNAEIGVAAAVLGGLLLGAWLQPAQRSLLLSAAVVLCGLRCGREVELSGPSAFAQHMTWFALASASALLFARAPQRLAGALPLRWLAAAGASIAGFALVRFLQPQGAMFLWNQHLGLVLLPIAALLAGGGRVPGLALLLLVLTAESYGYFERGHRSGGIAISVTWAVFAGGLLAAGLRLQRRAPRLVALGLLGLTLLKVVAIDLHFRSELARGMAFAALGLVLVGAAWLYHRFAGRVQPTQPGRESP